MRISILFTIIFWPVVSNAQGYVCAIGGGAEDYNAWSDAPYRWMVQKANNQRIIVLSANTETQWIPDYFMSFGADTAFNFRIGSTSVASDSATYRAITQSRAVFIKGGDQWDYVNFWRGTLTQQAIREVFLAGGVVGGTSAGAMVMGDVVSDAQFGTVLSRTVLRNPRSSTLTLTTNFLRLVPNSIFDSHFFERGRTGRLFAMLGKYYADTGQRILGMGVETSTAVCISPDGAAEVMGGGSVSFYYPTDQTQVVAVANQPLVLTYLKYDALVSGYKYNINSHQVTYVPPSAVVPGAGSSTPSVNAITLFGDAFPVPAGLTQFVNDAGGIASRYAVIVPPGSSVLGQRYVDSLVLRSVASVSLILLDLAGANNSAYGSLISQAQGIIFAANYSESFPSFVGGTTLVGQALRAKLAGGIAVAYASSDAKFAGTKVVFRTELEELASWKGKLILGEGMSALRNLLVMPLIFESDVYDENRSTGLVWGMAKTDCKTGIYVDEAGYVWIDQTGTIRSQGPSPLIVVDAREATHVGFSTYVVPGGTGARQAAAIVGAKAHVIAGAIDINPLPIQLASFTATYRNNAVRLDWKTLSEINNYGFEIQRSPNQTSGFASLPTSFVAGNGTTNQPHDYSFTDNSVQAGSRYYRLKQIDLDGTVHFSEPITVSSPTSVAANARIQFSLKQNYPNPFNPTTEIDYHIAAAGHVTLTVFDFLGREVATLANERMQQGAYSIRFDASKLSSGVYFARLVSGTYNAVQPMVLMR